MDSHLGLSHCGQETGVPLRAMLAYLFSEVAKNFYLIHHPGGWIEYVTRSQQGDRMVEIEPAALPGRSVLESEPSWEAGVASDRRLDLWLERIGAAPYDFNRELSDDGLENPVPPDFHHWPGGNFFRGLALIDFAEAMLKRAFGDDAVAVRVNAAGQGDYFQVHVDTLRVQVADVKTFLQKAFYRRFGLHPSPEFVEPHSGGGATAVRLDRYSMIPQMVARLRARRGSTV